MPGMHFMVSHTHTHVYYVTLYYWCSDVHYHHCLLIIREQEWRVQCPVTLESLSGWDQYTYWRILEHHQKCCLNKFIFSWNRDPWLGSVPCVLFSALTLLVGYQEGHLASKKPAPLSPKFSFGGLGPTWTNSRKRPVNQKLFVIINYYSLLEPCTPYCLWDVP